METFAWTVPSSAAGVSPDADRARSRLDLYLQAQTGKSRAFVREQIEAGRVAIGGAVTTKPAARVRAGDRITATWTPISIGLDLEPIAGPLAILYEDDDLLVIDKAPGVVVHPATAHRGPTLVHYVLFHLGNSATFRQTSETRPGLVHRLDVGTSGVIAFGKNREAQEHLARQFKDRALEKEYEAIVWGQIPPTGQFNAPIGRDRVYRTRMSSRSDTTRPALTLFTRTATYVGASHVALFPKTGRTHQLRVHLSEGGFPIVNDPAYGKGRAKSKLPEAAIPILNSHPHPFLHARRLRFRHPRNERWCEVIAPTPSHFSALLRVLPPCPTGM